MLFSCYTFLLRFFPDDGRYLCAKSFNRFREVSEWKPAHVKLSELAIMMEQLVFLHDLVDHFLGRADHQG